MQGRRVLALGACVVMVGCGAPLHGGTDAGTQPAKSAPAAPAVAACSSSTQVPISPGRPPDNKLPGYGFGSGPAYLTGQVWAGHAVWFSGETADVVVDSSDTGAVSVSGRQINGSGTVSFGGSAQTIVVKPQPPQSYWRYWGGSLTFSTTPGCYEIDLTGNRLREQVIVQVAAGAPPPG